ncbi:MAG TPA: alkaline phosphatase family protein [Lentisphaeria bacterium]|nr:alkaline phosphatase family protein [Lentisphaeria bacterium]HQL86777.1 alkaline phosphatase family protein [Lentisphaeria bacterium]
MGNPLQIFLFMDALGWQVAEKHAFLSDLLPYRQAVDMQFGYSCTALPTILTGQRPDVHRHLSFFYHDPEHSPFGLFSYLNLVLKPKSFWQRGRVRHHLSRLTQAMLGYTGYFQLYSVPFDRLPFFNYCEKRDIFAPGGLAPVPNLHDVLLASGLNFHLSDWRQPEAANLAAARAQAAAPNMRFLFIYTANLDGLLHQHINHDDVIRRQLDAYSDECRALLSIAQEHHDPVCLTIISDHGMTPLRGTVDLQADIDKLKLLFGVDYSACYDSTMARFWFLNPAVRPAIIDALTPAPGRWLSQEDMRRYGIAFPDHQFGEAFFLLDNGFQIIPSDMGLKPLPGMHGYAPEEAESQAAILSTHPFDDCPVLAVEDLFTLMVKRIEKLKKHARHS